MSETETSNRTRNRLLATIATVLSAIFFLEVFVYWSYNHDADKEHQHKFNQHYQVYSLNLPENLEFCGERVPMIDQDIRERMDRELLVNTYWQSNSMLYHKRAHKWFPIIEPILIENGVPGDFKYLCLVESGLMNLVSPSGAAGFWQLLKETGKQYGLEVETEVDERFHVEKATKAACKYLKEAYNRYGSWTLAAASYNMGMGGIDKQLKRQDAGNYYDLLLNEETSRYVFRILAAKEIMEHPTQYGFHYRLKDLYLPPQTYTVTVDSSITNMSAFAKKFGVNYKILKIFNPWLREAVLTNKDKKKYTIKFPKSGYSDFRSTELELDTLKASITDTIPTPDE